MEMNKALFYRLTYDITMAEHERFNIGTYKEKTLHRVLKDYFTTENAKEVDRVLASVLNPVPFDPGASTRGLYLRGVE